MQKPGSAPGFSFAPTAIPLLASPSPPERETLAEALGRALAEVKRGY